MKRRELSLLDAITEATCAFTPKLTNTSKLDSSEIIRVNIKRLTRTNMRKAAQHLSGYLRRHKMTRYATPPMDGLAGAQSIIMGPLRLVRQYNVQTYRFQSSLDVFMEKPR